MLRVTGRLVAGVSASQERRQCLPGTRDRVRVERALSAAVAQVAKPQGRRRGRVWAGACRGWAVSLQTRPNIADLKLHLLGLQIVRHRRQIYHSESMNCGTQSGNYAEGPVFIPDRTPTGNRATKHQSARYGGQSDPSSRHASKSQVNRTDDTQGQFRSTLKGEQSEVVAVMAALRPSRSLMLLH